MNVLHSELKEGRGSEARLRFLIRKTIKERNPQNNEINELEDFVGSWPHYKNGLLVTAMHSIFQLKIICTSEINAIKEYLTFQLMYEYSLRENFDLKSLIKNATSFLNALRVHYSEKDTLACIRHLREDLVPKKYKNQKIKPLITVLEVS